MTLAAPLFLVLGSAAAAAVAVLHFVARAQPPDRTLPTARFVPASSLRAPALRRRPSDMVLLALRVLALLLIGTGLAGPSPTGTRRPIGRVVLLDNSRAVADPADARVRAAAALAPGDVLVAFDSTARVVAGDGPVPGAVPVRGALSAALAIAVREAQRLGLEADSLELVVVSPVVEEEWDPAAVRLRALWPGSVRLERVAPAVTPAPPVITVLAGVDDPLRASIALLGDRAGPATVRVVRSTAAAEDSAVATAGGVLVEWPENAVARFGARASADSVGAVTADGSVVVATFPRLAAGPADTTATAVAWWVDGEVAATERRLGAGCVRQVAVPVAPSGDLAIRPAMLRFVTAMTAPCGGMTRLAPVQDPVTRAFVEGPEVRATVRPARAGSRPLVAALLGLALAALLAESLVRRRP